ncbi:MAG: precorrin-6y C5,15-methyltransferase (decarboxylating) subunit CbiE [Bacteroidales bacterium]
MEKKEFVVIGIDDNAELTFANEILKIILGATVFSGGKRHYLLVKKFLPQGAEWIDITVPLETVFEKYDNVKSNTIVVFASGDPLFFGFAVTLQKRLPFANVKVYPIFNSLQMLAHKLVMRYDDMRIISLTGRPWLEFDRALIERANKIGILTDGNHTPAIIAARATEYGFTNYKMVIGECLGGKEERINKHCLHEVVDKTAISPNCVIMERIGSNTDLERKFGISDELFMPLNGRINMITKKPVRLLLLSMLNLYNCDSFWDIGFCTGAVSIEAKMQFPHLRVASFEIRKEGRELMEVNSKRLGTPGIDVFIGDFTILNLDDIIGKDSENGNILPPDAVFIGGHGGKLVEIINKIYPVIKEGGRIVFNSVSQQSNNLFIQGITGAGMKLLSTVSITIDNYNTIVVMTAQK